MSKASYVNHRSAYHWALGVFLAVFGGLGYFLITELTHRAEADETPLLLSYAPFTLPIGLLLVVIPFVLEVLHRSNHYRLPETGFMAVLVLIPLLFYGWMDFSKTRFEGWLTGLEYERCATLDQSNLLPHEAWVKKGQCAEAPANP